MAKPPDYRANHLSCPLNAGKLGKVRDLVLTLRDIARQEAACQWTQFHRGRWQGFESMAKKGWSRPWMKDGRLSAVFSQMVMHQVAGSLQGYFGNVQNTYTELVSGASLPGSVRHQLHFINRRQAWFWACDVKVRQAVSVVNPKTGTTETQECDVVVDPDVRALARTLIRRALSQHRKPHFKAFQPQIDQRGCFVQAAHTAQHPYWLVVSTGKARERLALPLNAHPAFLDRNVKSALYQALSRSFEQGPPPVGDGQGFLAHLQAQEQRVTQADRNPHRSSLHVPNTVRLMLADDNQSLTVGVVSDISAAFEHQAATYQPLRPFLSLDLGLCTLLATDDGELHGRAWMAVLEKFDRLLTAIARHRQRLGLKVASERYRYHVQRLRGWLKSEIHRILNRLIARKRPAMLILEALNFSSPRMSRRMNRLIQNFGKGILTRKLAEIERQFGIVVEYRDSAYTSQECIKCGYVDARNRKSQDTFKCKFCNHRCHADIHAARVVGGRRSASKLGRSTRVGRQQILIEIVSPFNERYTRPRGGPADPRFTNPYFKEWAQAHCGVLEGCRAEVTAGMIPAKFATVDSIHS